MKKIIPRMLVVAAIALASCQSVANEAGPASGACDGSKAKVALYLDKGCQGGGVIHLAQLLKSSPDVACDFLNAADVQAGKLAGYDVLVMPGGSGYDRYAQLGEEGFERGRRRDGLEKGAGGGRVDLRDEPPRAVGRGLLAEFPGLAGEDPSGDAGGELRAWARGRQDDGVAALRKERR